jgi:hypothetical protein
MLLFFTSTAFLMALLLFYRVILSPESVQQPIEFKITNLFLGVTAGYMGESAVRGWRVIKGEKHQASNASVREQMNEKA